MKECTQCRKEKPLDEYHLAKHGAKGRAAKCKECVRENYANKYSKSTRERNYVNIVNGTEIKKCNCCAKEKDVSEFYPKGKTYMAQCKGCYKESRRKGTGPKPIYVVRENGVDCKECRSCGEIKPLENYAKLDRGVGGKRSKCIECEKELWKEYRKKNKEKTAEASRLWRERNPEKQEQAARRWRMNNPEKNALYMNRRKARLEGLRNELTSDEWEEIKNYFNGRCALSSEKEDVTMDHFIPISTGSGGTYQGNVYPLSWTLNMSKHNRNPFEWFQKYGSNHGVTAEKWEHLIAYLSSQNNMTPDEFEQYVREIFKEAAE